MSRLRMLLLIAVVVAFTMGASGMAQAVDEIRIGPIGPTTGWATIFGKGYSTASTGPGRTGL